jgi:hypothetical protein
VMRVMWKLVLFCLEMELALVQDRCMVCIKHTIGSKNVLDAQKSFWMHPMVLLGDEAQVETRFGLFGDKANLDSR